MATISGILRKCTVCGEPLPGDVARCECKFCGSVYAFANPQMEDELQTANAFRECTRFEEAETLYKQILKKYREYDLSEVYWNLLLCEQRVMFETDEKGERFPSFYAITDDEIEDSLYYVGAINAAEKNTPERVEIFKTLAGKMVRAKQLYTRIVESAKPYDLFICFKKSAFEGGDTKDCALAIDLYNHLAKDYNIFFSERSLKNVVVREFEPNIYHGLYTAKVMLVLCSKKEYVESQWVKNEWSRFHAFAQNPATGKTIIPIFLEDFSPRSLPNELMSYQGLPADYHLFDELGKTLRNILKPVDMEAELDRRMQAMQEQQRRQMEEQQRQMQEQLEAMRRAQEQFEAMRRAQEQPKVAPAPASAPVVTPTAKPVTAPKPTVTAAPKPTVTAAPKPAAVAQKPPVVQEKPKPAPKLTFEEKMKAQGLTVEGKKLIRCDKSTVNMIVPPEIEEIAPFAFKENLALHTITLPEKLRAIGEGAFEGCSSLESVQIPGSIKVIPKGCFKDCESLAEVTIGEGVERICEEAFYHQIGYYSKSDIKTCLSLPRSLREIEKNVFNRVIRTVNYAGTVEDWIKILFHDATSVPSGKLDHWELEYYGYTPMHYFKGQSITEYAFDQRLTEIPAYVFAGFSELKRVTVPAKVKTIGAGAFAGCCSLEAVTLPDGLQVIGKEAFSECMFDSIHIPDSVQIIGEGAFSACERLQKISIPDGVTELRANIFFKCYELENVRLPAGLTEIPSEAFRWTKLVNFTVPQGVKVIGHAAFDDARLEKIELPDSLERIEGCAFANNRHLKHVRVPAGVKHMAENAFADCEILRSVDGSPYVKGVVKKHELMQRIIAKHIAKGL